MADLLKVVSNGNYSSFLTEFGCDCKRCNEKCFKSHTSASIILEKNGKVLWHGLFDAGEGVVDSISKTLPLSPPKLDYLFFSHWHPDHTIGLNMLCETYKRSYTRKHATAPKISSWCRQGTGIWLKDRYAYELESLQLQTSVEFLPPGSILTPIMIKKFDLSITPVTVSHCTADIDPRLYKQMYCSCCFVIEWNDKKIVFLWDIDNKNQWIISPGKTNEKHAQRLLSNANTLFIDCNTWMFEEQTDGSENTGHIAFSTVQNYVNALNPLITIVTHMSGHEDGEGNKGWGWTNKEWRNAVSKEGNFDILNANEAMIL